MSEKKVVRNNSGKDITVEYGGMHHRFDAGKETECDAGLADVAQFRHGHQGLLIVHAEHEAQEAATKAAAAAVETLPAQEDGTPPPPASFTCPHGDFSTNDQVAHLNHLASAHGLSEQQQKEDVAAALPDAERPRTDDTPPPAESPSTETAPPASPVSAPHKAKKKAAHKAAAKPGKKKEKK